MNETRRQSYFLLNKMVRINKRYTQAHCEIRPLHKVYILFVLFCGSTGKDCNVQPGSPTRSAGLRNLYPEASSYILDFYYNNVFEYPPARKYIRFLSFCLQLFLKFIVCVVFVCFSNILQNYSLRLSTIIFFGTVKAPTAPTLPSRTRKTD